MRALILVAALIATACGGGHAVTGTMVLTSTDVDWTASTCNGSGGYSDIREGANIVAKDGAGKVLGTANLKGDPAGSSAAKCSYTWTMNVPDADFYVFTLGRRGDITYSKDELAGAGWTVGLTIGS